MKCMSLTSCFGASACGMYTDASRPKVERPAAGGHVHVCLAPEEVNRPAASRHIYGHEAPESKRPAADGHVHGRLAPEIKQACC